MARTSEELASFQRSACKLIKSELSSAKFQAATTGPLLPQHIVVQQGDAQPIQIPKEPSIRVECDESPYEINCFTRIQSTIVPYSLCNTNVHVSYLLLLLLSFSVL